MLNCSRGQKASSLLQIASDCPRRQSCRTSATRPRSIDRTFCCLSYWGNHFAAVHPVRARCAGLSPARQWCKTDVTDADSLNKLLPILPDLPELERILVCGLNDKDKDKQNQQYLSAVSGQNLNICRIQPLPPFQSQMIPPC